MAHVVLTAQNRTEFGNGPARRLRREGLVPGVVYRPGEQSLALALPAHDLKRTLVEGRTSVIDLRVGEHAARPVLVKEWQLHPTRGDVMHVDFQEVDLTQAIETPVDVVLVGNAVGVRDGGVLDQPLREVMVSALPDDLPDEIPVDVAELAIGDALTVADITAPEGVTIVSDPETVVASVVAPTVTREDVEDEEDIDAPAEPIDAEGDEPRE